MRVLFSGLSLGALASVAMVPLVQAQTTPPPAPTPTPAPAPGIAVSGGAGAGQAAFFTAAGGNPILYQALLNQLQLQTVNNGSTSLVKFTPKGASFTAAGTTPSPGDKGSFQGLLSGIAFSSTSGSPIPFRDRPAQIDFTLNSFNPVVELQGGLKDALNVNFANQKVFIPYGTSTTPVTGATAGELSIGSFGFNITKGQLGLPSDVQLGGTGSDLPNSALRVKYQLVGSGELNKATVADGLFGDLGTGTNVPPRLVITGNATSKFQVQTLGTAGQTEQKIQLNSASLALALGQGIINTTGLDRTQPVNYRIEGEAYSLSSLLGNDFAFVVGDAQRRDTRVELTQGTTTVASRFSGLVTFWGGTSTDVNLPLSPASRFEDALFASTSVLCTTCALPALNPSFNALIAKGSETSLKPVFNRGDQEDDNGGDVTDGDGSEAGDDLHDDVVTSPGEPRIIVIMVTGDRYYFVLPGKPGKGKGLGLGHLKKLNQIPLVVVFKEVGPSSKMFPGLGSLVELSFNDLSGSLKDAFKDALKKEGIELAAININVENSDNVNINLGNNNTITTPTP